MLFGLLGTAVPAKPGAENAVLAFVPHALHRPVAAGTGLHVSGMPVRTVHGQRAVRTGKESADGTSETAFPETRIGTQAHHQAAQGSFGTCA